MEIQGDVCLRCGHIQQVRTFTTDGKVVCMNCALHSVDTAMPIALDAYNPSVFEWLGNFDS